ncbi:MAG: hypothetical protein IH888_10925, partial [Planctomycetes bacterium]|nr:hypothetical protein [Planctomycetota bacterium]
MKMKTVSLLAGASVPLIFAASASGEFVGLKAVTKFVDPADIAADVFLVGTGITSLLVVNVYAEFTPGDAAAVIGAGGSAALGIPLQINTRDGTFFQHPVERGGGLSPHSVLIPIHGFNTLKH